MIRLLKYGVVFVLGFLVAKLWHNQQNKKFIQQETHVFLNEIKNLRKLVVSEGNFSEVYSFTDSKKYFYDYISFDKKAIVSVNAKVEVGYDLSQLEI